MRKEIITIRNLSVEYDGTKVLENNNLTVYDDDFMGIIGPNGGGKTTLLKVILGLVKPSEGEIRVFDDTPRSSRKHIGYVPQMADIDRSFPISVLDTVLMGRLHDRRILGFNNRQDTQAAERALRDVEMFEMRKRKTGELSGGERQRVLIARALVSEPRLLILDEPTASIDPRIKTGIYDLLKRLKGRMAIILVTHDIGVISSYIDSVACMNHTLFYHGTREIPPETLESIYHCPVDLIAHGVPHRVFGEH